MVLFDWREDQDAKMVDPNLSVYSVESIASQTSTFRAELQQSIADAQARQVNASGSVSEGIVDAAGRSKMTTVHELAHVFQKADDTRYTDDSGGYQPLLLRGLFQGSKEVMADCYALTYYNEWTLSDGVTESAYGYICGDSERQAIRDWAASMDAPLG
ncbi:hypothetical protein [Pseudoclavibacter sp. VKM Ac-2888]|uniref:hypothetical protein n=1 Tax=Pseudoclavibacter sp. VKM Ac-2888 TaxID=2783830 RepID=UPI00188B089E|nr:hypothetical protein [Pseudoclavibacter sp. VKM Ac-2888]MBF4549291.1 hypothetical protein [Pseudoclavibacter sp. VKM Ac-2888]